MDDTRTLPDSITIPVQALREWSALPGTTELNIPITKQEIDHLFFAIDKMIRSQDHMHTCLIRLSNGDLSRANDALFASQKETVESQNRLRQFLTEVILSATRGQGG